MMDFNLIEKIKLISLVDQAINSEKELVKVLTPICSPVFLNTAEDEISLLEDIRNTLQEALDYESSNI